MQDLRDLLLQLVEFYTGGPMAVLGFDITLALPATTRASAATTPVFAATTPAASAATTPVPAATIPASV